MSEVANCMYSSAPGCADEHPSAWTHVLGAREDDQTPIGDPPDEGPGDDERDDDEEDDDDEDDEDDDEEQPMRPTPSR